MRTMIRTITIVFFLLLPLNLFPQTSSMGLWGNVIETKAGTRLELRANKETTGEYALSITHRYQTLLRESLFLTINIPSRQIDNFKSQLKQLKRKYDEWYKIAKDNRVEHVEKDIPIALSAYGNMYGSKLSYPEEKEIKATFFVYNYAIHCIIKVSISGYNTYQLSEWVLTSTDLNTIISEIDKTIQHQRNYDSNQRHTQDLFQ